MARVLYLYSQVLRAGSGHARQTFQMLALMREAGLTVDVLTLPGGDPWPAGLAERIFRTAWVPHGRTLPCYGLGFRRIWATLVMALGAMRLFLTRRYTAVHCSDRAIRVGGLLAWLFGCRFIFEWRTRSGYDLVNWSRKRSRRFCRRVSLVFSDVRLPLSQLRETPFFGRIACLPCLPAPSIQRLSPPAVRLEGARQLFRVVAFTFAGAQAEDLMPLCEALPGLLRRNNLRLTVLGGLPPAGERLLPPGILASGRIDRRRRPIDPQTLMAAIAEADLIFFPALNGALPPPELLDCLAAGRAIMAVRCPAVEGLLSDDVALLVRGTGEAIAEGIAHAIESPLRCAELGAAGADFIGRERNASTAAATVRSCYAFALATQESPS